MTTLAELQEQFAKSLRNPELSGNSAVAIEQRRHTVYQNLVFNNISSLLSGTFPVLYATLNPELWNELIRQFLIQHRAQTPLFPKMPEEFLHFIQQSVLPASAPEWLSELAHYEWIELALQLTDIEDTPSLLETGYPFLSPLAVSLIYRFPVNRIGPDFQPIDNNPLEPTCLLAYRAFNDKACDFSDRVNFMTLTPAAARLLALLEENSDIDVLAKKLADELQQTVGNVKIFVLEFLNDLCGKGIIFGLKENT